DIYFDSVFIDFDNTLFDSYQFVEDAREVSKKFGIDEKIFNRAVHTAVHGREGNYYDYTFEFHLELMKEMGAEFSNIELLQRFEDLLIENKYEFDDSKEFLGFLKGISKKVYLLTAGNKNFQKKKLGSTDLADYLDDILICHAGKENLIGETIDSYDKALSINDNLRENKSIVKKYPEMMIITRLNDKKYSEEDAKEIGVRYFKTLNEIQKYVGEQIK
ncbi:hypothetical protein KJ641_00200, partial [Patescibacteria group bacterium]|nr:hypothetical protein [Patescibacteria group bacterium]MBU1895280.1 hypothetical protein [Patescibacteria group bacterium]